METLQLEEFQIAYLALAPTQINAGEGWAPGLLKISFWHDDEGPLGDLYIDPLARQVIVPSCLECVRTSPKIHINSSFEVRSIAVSDLLARNKHIAEDYCLGFNTFTASSWPQHEAHYLFAVNWTERGPVSEGRISWLAVRISLCAVRGSTALGMSSNP